MGVFKLLLTWILIIIILQRIGESGNKEWIYCSRALETEGSSWLRANQADREVTRWAMKELEVELLILIFFISCSFRKENKEISKLNTNNKMLRGNHPFSLLGIE